MHFDTHPDKYSEKVFNILKEKGTLCVDIERLSFVPAKPNDRCCQKLQSVTNKVSQ